MIFTKDGSNGEKAELHIGFVKNYKEHQDLREFIFENGGLAEPTDRITKIQYPVYNYEWVKECQRKGKLVDLSPYLLSKNAEKGKVGLKNINQESPGKSKVKRTTNSKNSDSDSGPSNAKTLPVVKKMKTLDKVFYSRNRSYSTGKNSVEIPKNIPSSSDQSNDKPLNKASRKVVATLKSPKSVEKKKSSKNASKKHDTTDIDSEAELSPKPALNSSSSNPKVIANPKSPKSVRNKNTPNAKPKKQDTTETDSEAEPAREMPLNIASPKVATASKSPKSVERKKKAKKQNSSRQMASDSETEQSRGDNDADDQLDLVEELTAVYFEFNCSNLRENPVTFTKAEDFKKIQDLKYIYQRRFTNPDMEGYSRDSFADCLERSSGVLEPAVELLKAGFVFENTSELSRKTLFTHDEDRMLLEGGFHELVELKSHQIVLERLEYLGYCVEN